MRKPRKKFAERFETEKCPDCLDDKFVMLYLVGTSKAFCAKHARYRGYTLRR